MGKSLGFVVLHSKPWAAGGPRWKTEHPVLLLQGWKGLNVEVYTVGPWEIGLPFFLVSLTEVWYICDTVYEPTHAHHWET